MSMAAWRSSPRCPRLTAPDGGRCGKPGSSVPLHALGFPLFNIIHVTNWVTNGLGERFPNLPVIWIEGGLAWVPFLMQRLDHEFMLRSCEYPTTTSGRK